MVYICYFINHIAMERIEITIHTKPFSHISQILAGFFELFGDNAIIIKRDNCLSRAHIQVNIYGKCIIYDLDDGYQNPDAMALELNRCNLYFKRSYSEILNSYYGFECSKIHPLGFNYFIASPLLYKDSNIFRRFLVSFFYYSKNSIISTWLKTPHAFECIPTYKCGKAKILFIQDYGKERMR